MTALSGSTPHLSTTTYWKGGPGHIRGNPPKIERHHEGEKDIHAIMSEALTSTGPPCHHSLIWPSFLQTDPLPVLSGNIVGVPMQTVLPTEGTLTPTTHNTAKTAH